MSVIDYEREYLLRKQQCREPLTWSLPNQLIGSTIDPEQLLSEIKKKRPEFQWECVMTALMRCEHDRGVRLKQLLEAGCLADRSVITDRHLPFTRAKNGIIAAWRTAIEMAQSSGSLLPIEILAEHKVSLKSLEKYRCALAWLFEIDSKINCELFDRLIAAGSDPTTMVFTEKAVRTLKIVSILDCPIEVKTRYVTMFQKLTETAWAGSPNAVSFQTLSLHHNMMLEWSLTLKPLRPLRELVADWRVEVDTVASPEEIETYLRGLVEAGVDPKAVDDVGNSLLFYAAVFWRRTIPLKYLIEQGADPKIENAAGERLLHRMLMPMEHSNAAYNTTYLTSAGLESQVAYDPEAVNHRDRAGKTPLFHLIDQWPLYNEGTIEPLIQKLVELKADPRVERDGMNLAVYALSIGAPQRLIAWLAETYRLPLLIGSETENRLIGRLLRLRQLPNLETLTWLRDTGVPFDTPDEGKPPIEIAIDRKNVKELNNLIRLKVDLKTSLSTGGTAFDRLIDSGLYRKIRNPPPELARYAQMMIRFTRVYAESDCVVCFGSGLELMTFQPCGHRCCCYHCLFRLELKCPICSAAIDGVVGCVPEKEKSTKQSSDDSGPPAKKRVRTV